MTEPSPSTSILKQLVERAGALYTLPSVAMRVLELTGQPQVDVRALKECLERDPALVAKILRVVNSSLFGASRKISDLNQALALLGVKPLKLLVLGFSLPKELWSGLEAQMLARYWRRSLVKAVAARALAEQVWRTPGDDAFIAGLLQDVGMLVLIQDLGETYIQFLERVQGEGVDLAALETSTLGFDHAMLSARLLAHWGLPEGLVRAVGLPARVERLTALGEAERPLPQTLHLAELVAALLVDERHDLLPELLEAGRQYRGLTLEQLTTMLETLEAKVAELASVLSLELPQGASFVDVIAKAHARLAEAAADAALGLPRDASAEASLWRETQSLQDSLAAAVGSRTHSTSPASEARRAAVQLAVDPGLVGRAAGFIAACRTARRSCSLLLVELDRYGDVALTHSPQGAEKLASRLVSIISAACEPADVRISLGDGRIAALLSGRDHQRAAELGREIMRRWSQQLTWNIPASAGPVSLSAGLATLALPPKNFPAQDLISAAERCLSAAQCSGGESLKSIELYAAGVGECVRPLRLQSEHAPAENELPTS